MTSFGNARCARFFVLLALTVLAAFAEPVMAADDLPKIDLPKILAKLDAASTRFKSAQADISWDNVQTEPIPDKDTQAGTVLFERKAGQLSMILHLKTFNGKPVLKDMAYAGGLFKLYEPRVNQMQVFKAGSNRAEYDTFLALGFGGSGKDLERTWQVTYAGTEKVDGDMTWKLELVPREKKVLETFTKVILWVDTDSGVALKQQSFDPSGGYRVVTYHHIHMNELVPSNAFEIKTAPGTSIVNH